MSSLAKFSKIVKGRASQKKLYFTNGLNQILITITCKAPSAHTIHITLMQKLDDEQSEGSGFVLNGIVNVILEKFKVNDIQASSYIEFPEKYRNNKSIINIKNDGQFCFLWCILAYVYPVEDHKNRTSNYLMHFDKLNLKGLEFPMKVKDIPKFENLNILNVNVFELN